MFAADFTPVMSRDDVRELDRATIESGTASLELMERAGACIVESLQRRRNELLGRACRQQPRVLIVAGSGNNGGDGYVLARLLRIAGWMPQVAHVGRDPKDEGDCAVNRERWLAEGGRILDAGATRELLAPGGAREVDLIVDALFGTGLDRDLDGDATATVEAVNRYAAHNAIAVVAVDVPSGLCADTGDVLGCAVRARLTVTLGAAKPGLFVGSGPDFSGRVDVADIGLLDPGKAGLEPLGQVIDAHTCAAWLEPRPATTHKGQLGHVLILGGSQGKTGAPLLAARGALRAGAGLVTVGVPATLAAQTDAALAEAMTFALPDNGRGALAENAWRNLAEPLRAFDAIAVGPGLGTDLAVRDFVIELVRNYPGRLVVDADALNVLADCRLNLGVMFTKRRRSGHGATILTPHPGEAARILAVDAAAIQADRLRAAEELSFDGPATWVLKGAATIVTQRGRFAFNGSGNAGMASAGMGDVLAGVCAAVTARVENPFRAAAIAVHVHGAAGDLMAGRLGGPGFLSSEVADTIPQAFAAVAAARPPYEQPAPQPRLQTGDERR